MNTKEFIDIINIIPAYIKYIYPGYLTIYVFLFFCDKKIDDNNYLLMKSIAISYIYIEFLRAFKTIHIVNSKLLLLYGTSAYEFLANTALIMVSLIVAYIGYRFVKSKFANKVFSFFNISTTYFENELEWLSNYGDGAWLVVYLNDSDVVYEGSLNTYNYTNDHPYIRLTRFCKYRLQDNGKPKEPYIEDHANEPNESVTIYRENIKIIEKRR